MKELKLIDFGLCTRYINESGEHMKQSKSDFRGNIAFSSPYAMLGTSLSRRDDLISLTYLMLFLNQGSLKFLEINQAQTGFEEILQAKLSHTTT